MAPILLLIFSLLLPITTAELTDQELNAAISALRSHGYTLFPNAIATSDLSLQLLSSSTNSTFTLFAPTDQLLYSLDLSSWAPHYTTSLLRHVSPSHFTTSNLRTLASSRNGRPYLQTLVPQHALFVERSRVMSNGSSLKTVKVDGVRVSVPDLFIGSDIAVHGLEGILVGGSDLGFVDWVSPASSPAPMSSTTVNGNEHAKFSKFTF